MPDESALSRSETAAMVNPASEVGDAGAFALMAGAISAVTTLIGTRLDAASRNRDSAAGPAAT